MKILSPGVLFVLTAGAVMVALNLLAVGSGLIGIGIMVLIGRLKH